MDVERFSKLGIENLHQGQIQQALEAFTNAHKSAQALGNHGYMQRACAFNLGALLISMGRFNDGLHYLNLAKPDEGCRDGRSNGDLFFNYGLAYEGLKNIPESRRYFEKALDEYISEHSNVKMEADTTRRLGQLCVTSCLFSEAEAWMKKLIQAYESLGDKENRYQAEAERANLLLKMGRVEEAEEIADDCVKGAKLLMSPITGNVFNEIGLVYTQMAKYEKALESSQCALSILKSTDCDGKLIAVVYQNMGALYNYMGRFQEAVEYHKMAIEKHAVLKNRKSQGHCFINLGYAYSQLKDLDKAGESFLHAVQAAKDCGDKKSEWQSYEALGSVAYSLGDLRRAKDYYKQSVSTVGQSPDFIGDKEVQDRILSKLTHVIQAQARKSMATSVLRQGSSLKVKKREMSAKQTTANPVEGQATMEKLVGGNSGVKDQRVIAIKHGSKIKHLKIRRSGTLRQFKKFALGLDISRPTTAELKARPSSDNVSILSAETITELEVDEEDATESDDSESEAHKSSAHKQAKEQDGIEAYEDSDESGDDIRKVQAEMKKVASLKDIDMPGTSGFVSKKVSADVHAKAQDLESDSEDNDSDMDSSNDSEDIEEIDKDDSTLQRKSFASPFPSSSAPATANVTYETPLQGEPLYETVDHKGKSRGNTQEPNPSAYARSGNDQGASDIFSGTVYESIRSQSRQGLQLLEGDSQETRMKEDTIKSLHGLTSLSKRLRNMPEGTGSAIQEEDEKEDSLQEMSRAQRDVLMFNEFKKGATIQEKSRESEEVKESDQKNSKHCILM
ncbi:hypothetical protein RRG08_063980 [Elysia crispata]|uniref:Uncharacterized protein n=1 Tax=Elysia crispata TaxID=231223 RepID=A0AAE0YEG8_9GAST|nr:hypothetical protein RRG08_063980 [Elysia crispata]